MMKKNNNASQYNDQVMETETANHQQMEHLRISLHVFVKTARRRTTARGEPSANLKDAI